MNCSASTGNDRCEASAKPKENVAIHFIEHDWTRREIEEENWRMEIWKLVVKGEEVFLFQRMTKMIREMDEDAEQSYHRWISNGMYHLSSNVKFSPFPFPSPASSSPSSLPSVSSSLFCHEIIDLVTLVSNKAIWNAFRTETKFHRRWLVRCLNCRWMKKRFYILSSNQKSYGKCSECRGNHFWQIIVNNWRARMDRAEKGRERDEENELH